MLQAGRSPWTADLVASQGPRWVRGATDLASAVFSTAGTAQAQPQPPASTGSQSSAVGSEAAASALEAASRDPSTQLAASSKLIADTRDPALARQLAIAKVSGYPLAGADSVAALQSSMRDAYPPQAQSTRLYPPGTLEDTQLEILRRNNLSMPCQEGQRVYGSVFCVTKHRVWVEVGNSLTVLGRKVRCALTLSNSPRVHAALQFGVPCSASTAYIYATCTATRC